MDRYKSYIAEQVLSEGHIVTYRSLSRALNVHVNLAKQMLYDFSQKQNAKEPRSIHATYLLSGTQRVRLQPQANGNHGAATDDKAGPRSPPISSMPDNDAMEDTDQLIKLVSLAKEESLEDAKSKYIEITSIHVYSIQAGPLKDFQLLSARNQETISQQATQDPLEAWKMYGTIHSPHVKRRTGRGPPPRPSQPIATSASKSAKPSEPVSKETKGPVAKSSPFSSQRSTTTATPKGEGKPRTLKRDTSDIFKSFSKAKTKVKDVTKETSDVSSAPDSQANQSAAEDEAMKDASDDEPEVDLTEIAPSKLTAAEKKARAEKAEAERSARVEREEALRKMMDVEDEEMEDASQSAAEEEEKPIDAPSQPLPVSQSETEVTTTGGRRRGRRRVMKKKTVKDEEGYLVTKEEAAWESFSEEEPEPKKQKVPISAPSSKAKKGPAKPGQGNIMSFFAKK